MFQYLSQLVGFPIEEVKYFTCFLLSFPLALILRVVLSYKTTSVTIRNAYCAGSGILLCILCFDWSTIYLIMYAGIPYAMLYLIRRDVVQWYILGFCYISLGYYHAYRIIISYGRYLDLNIPLMVTMQRITYIGFCYHDGGWKEDKLSEDQKVNKITNRPTVLEYFSYVFSFYSVLTGPSTPYILHDDFITGRNIEKHLVNGKTQPSNVLVVLRKAGMAGVYIMINLIITSFDGLESAMLHDQSMILPLRIVYVALFCFATMSRYYFVWSLIESISNLAGLGFNGFDETGKPKWDLVNNFNMFIYYFDTLEHAVKELNHLTVQWLRRIIYDRVDKHKNYWTFAASSVWHGFYPGYYYIWLQLIPSMEAARRIRCHVRPHFQSSRILQLVYNIASLVLFNVVRDYATLAFICLEPHKVYKVWKHYYFAPLIASIVAILLLPPAKRKKLKDKNN